MEISNRIYSEVEKINEKLEEEGIQTQSHGRVIELPHITQLREGVETYLYNSKSTLRDLARLFDIFFDKQFTHSRYNEIQEWAEKHFAENEPLPALLKNNQGWIKDIVKRRNAVEHPGGYSGHLYIDNYQLTKDKATGLSKVIPPTWHLNNENATILHADLGVILVDLLEFSEDLLVGCLRQYGSKFPIVFHEIPEEKRDPKAPVRLDVTIDIEKLKT